MRKRNMNTNNPKKLNPYVMLWITFAISAANAIASVLIDNSHDFGGRFVMALLVPLVLYVFVILSEVEEIKEAHKHAESFDFITNKENRENTGLATPDCFYIGDKDKLYKYNVADVDIWIMRNGTYQPFQRVKPVEVFDLTNNAVNADYNPVE